MNSDKENAFHSQERGKLVEDLEMFRLLYENTPLGYQSLDIEGNLKIVNQAWLDLLGYSNNKEVVGRSFGDFITDKNIFKERFPKFKSCGITNNAVFEMIKKDGTLIFVSIDGRITYDKNNNFIQTHCILNDITERYKVENALKESERRFRETLENANMFAIQLDCNGRIIFANQYLSDITGWKAKEIIGKDWIDICIPEDKRENLRVAHFENIHKDQILKYYENEILLKSGEKRLIAWTNSAMHDTAGNIIGITSLGNDITERMKAAEALKTHATELERINRSFVGRELKMIELKQEIEELKKNK